MVQLDNNLILETESMSRREAAAKDKLNRILDAATVAFAEKGFHGTTIPDVATSAGVGAGTIYRYFANKENLVNGVYINSKTKLLAYLTQDYDAVGCVRGSIQS